MPELVDESLNEIFLVCNVLVALATSQTWENGDDTLEFGAIDVEVKEWVCWIEGWHVKQCFEGGEGGGVGGV